VGEKVRGFAERVTCPQVQFWYKDEIVFESRANPRLKSLAPIEASNFA